MTSPAQVEPDPWNHNSHYYPLILTAVPRGCQWALDVGCGQGALTRRLRQVVPSVTGIDRDERSIDVARSHPGAGDIDYVCDDFLTRPWEPASAGLVTAVASLHHGDEEQCLARMRDLLRPGGVLVVVGLARIGSPRDLLPELPAALSNRVRLAAQRRQGASDGSYQSPVVSRFPHTYGQVRRLARRMLPGARYRRHLYWRYSLVWTKPA